MAFTVLTGVIFETCNSGFQAIPAPVLDLFMKASCPCRCGVASISLTCKRRKVRAVQRRLGMLASTSDLSEEFKEQLRGIRGALEQQRSCNNAVDGVVSEKVTRPISVFSFGTFQPESVAARIPLRTPDTWALHPLPCTKNSHSVRPGQG